MTKLIDVEVLRPYPRGGTVHQPGARISIPEYAVGNATAASPPHVRVLEPGEIELDSDFDATEGALDLARAIGMDLSDFAGQGSGEAGRIQKPDVERWAKERGLVPAEG